MDYTQLIKTLQARTKLNMRQLARKWNVAESTIYARMKKNDPPYSELVELSEIAGVTVDELVKWGRK